MVINPFGELRPVGPDFARLPILEAFNWSECLAAVEGGQWYVVAFRSIRSETADPVRLRELDDLAYAEAQQDPGLLFYFRGTMNERRECLSVCVWESQERAQAATRLPSHQAAAAITDDTYQLFALERWILSKCPASGRLAVQPVRVEGDQALRYASAATQQRDPVKGLDSLLPGIQMTDSSQSTFA